MPHKQTSSLLTRHSNRMYLPALKVTVSSVNANWNVLAVDIICGYRLKKKTNCNTHYNYCVSSHHRYRLHSSDDPTANDYLHAKGLPLLWQSRESPFHDVTTGFPSHHQTAYADPSQMRTRCSHSVHFARKPSLVGVAKYQLFFQALECPWIFLA